jgi:asparaginyl-tRNA synthetase
MNTDQGADANASTSERREWRPDPLRYLAILESPLFSLIVDLQDRLQQDSVRFWSNRSVKFMHLPITTGAISSPMGRGSDSVPVRVDLMGQPTYLADSMQFMLEYGCRINPSGAWYLMPSFRGEMADETHLNQFFHSEAEVAGDLNDVLSVAEDYVRSITRGALDVMEAANHARLGIDVSHLVRFLTGGLALRMSMDEAHRYLGDNPLHIEVHEGYRVLTRAGERRLMSEVSPVIWVTHHDHLSVPFYQAYDETNRDRASCGDLLFGVGEVVGAGQRHFNGDQVRQALSHHEVEPAPYRWYLSMKDKFPMQTSGFGLGVERWLQWVLSAPDIRELQLVPRLNGMTLEP